MVMGSPGLDHRVHAQDGVVLGDLVLLGGLLGELHLLALEAVEDDGGVQRALVLEIDEEDLLHARVDELLHVVRMDLVPGAVELLLRRRRP